MAEAVLGEGLPGVGVAAVEAPVELRRGVLVPWGVGLVKWIAWAAFERTSKTSMLDEEAGPVLSVEERKSAKVALLLCEVEEEAEVDVLLNWLRESAREAGVAGAEV